MSTDYYETLGVGRDATIEELRSAHRAKAKACHPDAGGDAEAFGRIQQAWEVLRDPARRRRYDETGDSKPDTTDADAVWILMQAFATAVNTALSGGHSLTGGSLDLVSLTQRMLKDAKIQAAREHERAVAMIPKLAKLRQQLKRKEGATPLLEQALDARIQAAHQTVNDSAHQKAVTQLAHTLSLTYEPSNPADPFAAAMRQSMHTQTWTGPYSSMGGGA